MDLDVHPSDIEKNKSRVEYGNIISSINIVVMISAIFGLLLYTTTRFSTVLKEKEIIFKK